MDGPSEGVNTRGIAIEPAGSVVAFGYENDVLRWDLHRNDRLAVLSGHDQPVNSIAFSPNGDRLISGGEDKTIRVWNPVTGDLMLTLRGQDSEVESLGFSPDGSTIVAVYADGAVWSWHSMQAADP